VSVAVAVQVLAWPRFTDGGEHETAVEVGRLAGAVTVRFPVPLLTAWAASPA
jgi:hypothetical protein